MNINAVVLSGMSSIGQMEDNLSYMTDFTPLVGEKKALCHKAAEIINARITVPCTGCSYCTGGCPLIYFIANKKAVQTSGGKVSSRRTVCKNSIMNFRPGVRT